MSFKQDKLHGRRKKEADKKIEVNKENIENLKSEIQEIRKLIEESKKSEKSSDKKYENAVVNKESKEVIWMIEENERKKKRNNIIIKGLNEGEQKNKEKVEKIIAEKLEVNCKI